MPVIGIGFSTLLAISLAIHVIQTGQDRYWLFILLAFPIFGSLVYLFVVVLPQFRGTHSGYHFESKLRKALDPNRELREAQTAFEISSTVDSQTRLAKALVDSDRAQEALPYYQQALSGVYKTAPDILLQYAYALFKSKQYYQARETLDLLRETNPNYRSDEGHLLYAKILVCLGEKQLAKEEFHVLIDYYPSLEALSQYLQVLVHWNDFIQAEQLLQNYKMRLKHMPRHTKRINAQWIKEIKQSEEQLNKNLSS